MMGKAHGWGTFQIQGARVGHHLLLGPSLILKLSPWKRTLHIKTFALCNSIYMEDTLYGKIKHQMNILENKTRAFTSVLIFQIFM
jgi:hypothetical protein